MRKIIAPWAMYYDGPCLESKVGRVWTWRRDCLVGLLSQDTATAKKAALTCTGTRHKIPQPLSPFTDSLPSSCSHWLKPMRSHQKGRWGNIVPVDQTWRVQSREVQDEVMGRGEIILVIFIASSVQALEIHLVHLNLSEIRKKYG